MSVEQITRDKLEKMKQLSDAIVRAREMLAECHTYENALSLQQLEEQRRALRATVGFAVIEGGRKDEPPAYPKAEAHARGG